MKIEIDEKQRAVYITNDHGAMTKLSQEQWINTTRQLGEFSGLFEVFQSEIDGLRAQLEEATRPKPMRLPCEGCGEPHVDEGEFATRPHHTHSCQRCGLTWRPAIGPTVGVRFLPGFLDEEKSVSIKTYHLRLEEVRFHEHLMVTGRGVITGDEIDGLMTRMVIEWKELERVARLEHYDVLTGSATLRQSTMRMLKLLCEVPGATALQDVGIIRMKDREYGGSWQSRGGSGAFHAAARKWDRLVSSVRAYGSLDNALRCDTREEGIQDDIGDLRRYLVLWEAWRLEHDRLVAARVAGDAVTVAAITEGIVA